MRPLTLTLFFSATAAAFAAGASRNYYEGGAFESFDGDSGKPTATSWRWALPDDPFTEIGLSQEQKRSGESSLHLKDGSTAHVNQTLGHVVSRNEIDKMRGMRVEYSVWVKQAGASSHKVVGIGLWGRTSDGGRFSACDWTGTTLPGDWMRLKATVVVPENADLLIAQLHCASGWGETGEAFFDDAELTIAGPAPRFGSCGADSGRAGFRNANTARESVFHQAETAQNGTVPSRGVFWRDGRPVFFMGPWIYQRSHIDWPDGNPDRQGIGHRAYIKAPGREIFESMGFNASQLSSAPVLQGQELYNLPLPRDSQKAEERLDSFFARFENQPMVVDFAFGFSEELKKANPVLAREIAQQNGAWHQFVPFCPESPDGLRYYEAYLKGGAAAVLKRGVNVLVWELFNESVYKCQCRHNAAAFAAESERVFGTIDRANDIWHTFFDDFPDVARQTEFRQFPRLWPDYMKFMAGRYAAFLRVCKGFVREIDKRPGVLFAEQSSTFNLTDVRGAGMDYRLVADELDVLAYEGGIRFGHGSAKKNATDVEQAAFSQTVEHLFAMDFYRVLARSSKPIVNHEHYCMRIEDGKRVPSLKEDIVTSLWAEFFHGSAGTYTYCWDKRSWEWKTLDDARRIVEKPSYKSASLLNPWNYPPETLSGFAQFRAELEPVLDAAAPLPRTKPASVALFFSYPTLRMLDIDKVNYKAKLFRWYGAILGAQYPVQVVFEEDLATLATLGDLRSADVKSSSPQTGNQLSDVRAIVVPCARYATPESAEAVARFAASGGTVVADSDAFLRDERGDALPKPPGVSIMRLDADSPESVPALLAALDASGARRDAVFVPSCFKDKSGGAGAGAMSFAESSFRDIQVIDRGNMLLLLLIDMGITEPQTGLLKWNVGRKGRYRLTDAATGLEILNNGSATWDAADLAVGIPVTVQPQRRLLLRLDEECAIIFP